MASGNRENSKTPTPVLQINGQTLAGDNRYSKDEFPETFGRVGEAWVLDTPTLGGHDVSDAVETLIDINRRLLSKIEILHMRDCVDSKQRGIIQNTIQEKGKRLEEKETEINHLKSDLEKKEAVITKQSEENKQKNTEIHRLQQYANELRKDVEPEKKFADDILCQQIMISDIKTHQPDAEKDSEILQIRTEVNSLKEHLATLEHEMLNAKDKIAEQKRMMRLMENDRSDKHQKFQNDVHKVNSLKEHLATVEHEMREARDKIADQQEIMRLMENDRSDIHRQFQNDSLKVNSMKKHLASLEHEMLKARDKIEDQQEIMRLMENDRGNIQRKFQNDSKKVELVVRNKSNVCVMS